MAHWLRDRGFEAYAVRGGIAALTGEGLEAEDVPAEEVVATPAQRVLTALRHPLFRRYSAGVLLSLIGNWVEASAYGYVVLLLGGSAAPLRRAGLFYRLGRTNSSRSAWTPPPKVAIAKLQRVFSGGAGMLPVQGLRARRRILL